MSATKVVVAMSGGVDSSVAAALLLDQGFHVLGVALRMWVDPSSLSDRGRGKEDGIESAQAVTSRLGIDFHVLDAREIFRTSIVAYTIAEYGKGRTPNPCLLCNPQIKWGFLMRHVQGMGIEYLASGHYARIRKTTGGYQLLRGRDDGKDQSYMLASLGQDDLARTYLPLGDFSKPEVRQIAKLRKLPVAERPESQDICFLPGGNYREFLMREAPELFQKGPILDSSGRQLGWHNGIAGYTIGQRKRIGISAAVPLYVQKIDANRNAIVVAHGEELGHSALRAEEATWLMDAPPARLFTASAKIRYKAREVPVNVELDGSDSLTVRFLAPLRDITPGQGIVFYQNEICLGKAIIAEALE